MLFPWSLPCPYRIPTVSLRPACRRPVGGCPSELMRKIGAWGGCVPFCSPLPRLVLQRYCYSYSMIVAGGLFQGESVPASIPPLRVSTFGGTFPVNSLAPPAHSPSEVRWRTVAEVLKHRGHIEAECSTSRSAFRLPLLRICSPAGFYVALARLGGLGWDFFPAWRAADLHSICTLGSVSVSQGLVGANGLIRVGRRDQSCSTIFHGRP